MSIKKPTSKSQSKIRSLLHSHNLGQGDLAQILGINPATVSNKMNQKTDWTVTEANRICAFFDVEYKDIFFE
ncbi:MAG: helix-turn-helix transcriptional regulator [Candidatus Magnetobacterium sp. LHC-1]